MKTTDDEACLRNACGILADAANYLEKDLAPHLKEFMDTILDFMAAGHISFDTKMTALVTIGNIFLVSENFFVPYLEKTMHNLEGASNMCFNTAG